MKFSQLKKYIEDNPQDAFFCVEGDDAYFREKAQSMLTGHFVTGYPQMNITILPSSTTIKEIEENCAALPLMSKRRIVVIKEYYPAPSQSDMLQNIKLYPDTCILIVSNFKKSIIAGLGGNVTYVDCNRESVAVLCKWITVMLKARKINIDYKAAEKLAEYCGQDMTRIANETDKLANCGKGTLTEADIEQNVAKEIEYQAYMLANAVASHDKNIYFILKDIISKGGAQSRLIRSLYNNYKRMFYVKDSRLSKEQLKNALGIKPYAVTMTAKAAARYDKAQLKDAMEKLCDIDYKIKSGYSEDIALYYTISNLLNKNYG